MTAGKIYKYALVLVLISSIISCSKRPTILQLRHGCKREAGRSWTCDENSKIGGKASYTITIAKDVTTTDE